MGTLLDILDAPDDHERPSQYNGWILVATLAPEQIADLVHALEEAAIDAGDLYFKKDIPSKVGNIIVPLTANELGNIKTLVFVSPESANKVQLIVDQLPEPAPLYRISLRKT